MRRHRCGSACRASDTSNTRHPYSGSAQSSQALGRQEPSNTTLNQAGANVLKPALGLDLGQWGHEPQNRCIRGPWFPWGDQALLRKLVGRQVAQHALGQVPGPSRCHAGSRSCVGTDVFGKALLAHRDRFADVAGAEQLLEPTDATFDRGDVKVTHGQEPCAGFSQAQLGRGVPGRGLGWVLGFGRVEPSHDGLGLAVFVGDDFVRHGSSSG